MAYMYNMWLSSSIYIQVRPLRKEKFQRSYSRSTASSSAWICVVIDDIAWCAQHYVQSRQVQRHTHWTTHFHIESFLLYVLLELLLYCAHTKTVFPILLLLPLHFKKVVNLISPMTNSMDSKKFNRASNFLRFLWFL